MMDSTPSVIFPILSNSPSSRRPNPIPNQIMRGRSYTVPHLNCGKFSLFQSFHSFESHSLLSRLSYWHYPAPWPTVVHGPTTEPRYLCPFFLWLLRPISNHESLKRRLGEVRHERIQRFFINGSKVGRETSHERRSRTKRKLTNSGQGIPKE